MADTTTGNAKLSPDGGEDAAAFSVAPPVVDDTTEEVSIPTINLNDKLELIAVFQADIDVNNLFVVLPRRVKTFCIN
jgi:hypothetical protein